MRTSANRMLGIVVAIVALIAVIVGVFSATQSPSNLDPNSPEGVVQQYVTAVFDSRNDDAAKFFDTASKCTADDLDRYGTQQDARVDLTDVNVSGDTARVSLHIEHNSGDPFGGSWTEDKTLRLTRTSGAWKLSGIPWPLYDCGGVVVK